MKTTINAILVFIAMTITLFNACSSKSAEMKKAKEIEKKSWKYEVTKTFQLVRPIEFEEDAVDVYGGHLINHRETWYIINRNSNCFLLPVKIRHGINPSLVEQLVDYSHKAVIDTMSTEFYNDDSGVYVRNPGLRGVKKLEIVCLNDPASEFEPCAGSQGEMSVCVSK